MKKTFLILILLFSFLFSFSQPQLFYICTGSFQLQKLDISTCDTLPIGLTATPLGDIALTPDQRLYGISGAILVEVDTATAALTTIALMNFPGGNSLVSDSAGNLLTVASDSLYQIDRFTGQVNSLGFYGTHSSAGDLTFYDDTLYLSADSGKLVKIILQPLGSQVVGFMNVPNIYGINTVCLNGRETMIASGGDYNFGSIYTVNTSNASLTLLCDSIVHQPIYGAASPLDFGTGENCFFNGVQIPPDDYELKIFPNPVTDILNVSYANSEVIVISIFDLTSKRLIRKEFINSVSLNLEGLSSGVYLFQIESDQGIVKRGKLIKTNN